MVKVVMTADEFASIQPRLGRLTLDTVRIARRVLVDGASQVAVARENGITKQRVSTAVHRVIAAAHEFPADWECVEAWLPPALAAKVRQMADDARKAL